jgi:hypothetical protein
LVQDSDPVDVNFPVCHLALMAAKTLIYQDRQSEQHPLLIAIQVAGTTSRLLLTGEIELLGRNPPDSLNFLPKHR